jgi:hypothetical protein
MKFDDAYDSDKLFAYDSNEVEDEDDSILNGGKKGDDSSDNGGEEFGHVGQKRSNPFDDSSQASHNKLRRVN